MKIKIEEEELVFHDQVKPLGTTGAFLGKAIITGRAIVRGHEVVFDQLVEVIFSPPNVDPAE